MFSKQTFPQNQISLFDQWNGGSEREYFFETLFQALIREGAFDKIIEYEKDITVIYPKNFNLLFDIAFSID